MLKIPFRDFHLLKILETYSKKKLPLDLIIGDYFHANKALGSKDRAYIANTAYHIIRWKGLLNHILNSEDNWEEILKFISSNDLNEYVHSKTIPPHIRVSFPEILFDLLKNSYGIDRALELCLLCNEQAPATIRVNTLKISRDKLFEKWKNEYQIRLCKHSKTGIIFDRKINFFGLPEFKEGFFEVQDEGSQLLAELIEAMPGDQILDFCSGSGGKALAIAPKMAQKGQLFLHDIREKALIEAKKRLKRAGIQNAQIIKEDSLTLKKLKKKMDWILVDAPCSGTGTLRRNPDMKWRFDEETVPKLVGLQRIIFEKALSYLKPEGKIVYATCSMLFEENQQQVEHFLRTYPLEVINSPLQTWPKSGEMDGFFGVTFKFKN